MRIFVLGLFATLIIAATACGSDGTDASGRELPAADGYDRVLRLADNDVKTPDFTLTSTTGDVVRLSDMLGEKPIALIFYRGFF